MILYGQYDSPFVRRVAVTLHLYGMAFERNIVSAYGDFETLLQSNPLGKVPALELDSGELLFDSQAILDHLDQAAGPDRALVPAEGQARRAVLRRATVALGLAEKAVALRTELYRRAPGTTDPAWVERLQTQITSALRWLDGQSASPWYSGESLGQDDVTAAVTYTYLLSKLDEFMAEQSCPKLSAINAACEALPAFQAAPFEDD